MRARKTVQPLSQRPSNSHRLRTTPTTPVIKGHERVVDTAAEEGQNEPSGGHINEAARENESQNKDEGEDEEETTSVHLRMFSKPAGKDW